MQPHPVPPEDPQYTLGVVIPVPEPPHTQLRDWRASYGGQASLLIEPHVTLVTGSLNGGASWQDAAQHLHRVCAAQPPFTVQLGAAISFRPLSPVVYLPLRQGLDACRQLHQALLRGPLRHDSPFEYHPHLTIAQNVTDAELDAALHALSGVELRFTVDQVQLFAMHAGTWQLREQLALLG